MRGVVLRRHEAPARLLVEPVNDSRPLFPADPRERAAVVQERVDHCSLTVPCSRVDDHPRGLVDYNEIFIFKKHLERNALRQGVGRFHRWNGERHPVIQPEALRGFRGSGIQLRVTGFDQLLYARSRQLGMRGEKAVETRARVGD